MDTPPTDRRAVEAAVASLQERLADGDPADTALRSHCEAVLLAMRAAYRANPSAFSREVIEALRELNELLRQTDPEPHAGTLAAEPPEQRFPGPPASSSDEGAIGTPAPRDTKHGQEISSSKEGHRK